MSDDLDDRLNEIEKHLAAQPAGDFRRDVDFLSKVRQAILKREDILDALRGVNDDELDPAEREKLEKHAGAETEKIFQSIELEHYGFRHGPERPFTFAPSLPQKSHDQ
jgi:hypothetical protein